MKAVITVVGKDTVGILAAVSNECAKHNINVLEVTQSILQDLFAMIMLVDISGANIPFSEFQDILDGIGKNKALSIHCMHEDIFNAMHKI
ncbi:MAG: ACT domain-containing protein [Clostridiales bacterium]|nr:ACT domain-containing protein [Clostridiales bacterium]